MIQKFAISALLMLVSGASGLVSGQTPAAAVKPSVISGDVTAIDENRIVVAAKNGSIDANITAKTEFKKVSAAKPDLGSAVAAVRADIVAGDRVIVTGVMAADGKSLPARTVYLMSKADISQKNAKEADEWRTRGIAGKVVSVNPTTNQISVEVRGLAASTNVMVTPKDSVKYLRYAPDSERYDEAKQSSLGEIKAGDMIRALGDKSSDGTSVSAEKVLTGAFQTIAGTVKSVDGEKKEIVITDLQSKKDVTVSVGTSSILKRFPTEMAERMAGMQAMQAGGARPVGGGARPVGGRPQATPPVAGGSQTPGAARPGGMGGGQRGAAAGGLDDMLERLPTITATDLKAGDMIAVSSTKHGTSDRVKAIKLVAGVEPFLRMAQAAGGGRRGQGGVDSGFSIPGLDGIGFP
ncbi:MAG: hypothetical protein WKF34_12655 [Pyrinomonadaceae bacterium]